MNTKNAIWLPPNAAAERWPDHAAYWLPYTITRDEYTLPQRERWPDAAAFTDDPLGDLGAGFVTVSKDKQVFASKVKSPGDSDVIFRRLSWRDDDTLVPAQLETDDSWVEVSFSEYNWLVNKDRASGQDYVKKSLESQVVKNLLD